MLSFLFSVYFLTEDRPQQRAKLTGPFYREELLPVRG